MHAAAANPNLPKSPAEWFETANLVQTLVADVGGMGIMACRRLGQSTRARWIIAADRRRSRLLCSCPCGQLKSEAVASNSTFPYRKPKTADRDCEAADTRSRHSV